MFNQKIVVMKKLLFISMVMAGALTINQKTNAMLMDRTTTVVHSVLQGVA